MRDVKEAHILRKRGEETQIRIISPSRRDTAPSSAHCLPHAASRLATGVHGQSTPSSHSHSNNGSVKGLHFVFQLLESVLLS